MRLNTKGVSYMNKIILTGRLTRDVELRYDPGNKPVAGAVLAVDRPFINASGVREADFIPLVIWGKGAEYLKEKCHKTSRILVEGRLQIRNFDAKDGTKHWVAEVIVSSYELLDKKEDNTTIQTEETKPVVKNATAKTSKKETKPISSFMLKEDVSDDDIPW